MQTQETTLDKIRSRPRFKIITPLSKQEYTQKLKQYLALHKETFSGNVNQEVAEICVRTPHEDYWKPKLSLRIEQEGDHTVIRGVFGPSSSVWTFFMFLYFGSSVSFMIFITIWLIEKQLGSTEFPWALSVAVASLVFLGLTYLASLLGKTKAKAEMQKLREFAVGSQQSAVSD